MALKPKSIFNAQYSLLKNFVNLELVVYLKNATNSKYKKKYSADITLLPNFKWSLAKV